MIVFVSEYVCGGGWAEPEVPASLVREGRAMLQAIVQDFSRVPACRVVTTLDAGQPPLEVSHVDVVRVAHPDEEADVFTKLAAESDVCLIIAPELGNVLYDRCEMARRAGVRRLLNPASDVVRLCSDKLRLFEFLTEQRIATIPTLSWNQDAVFADSRMPIVIKPRFGAGSQDVHVFPSVAAARREMPPPAAGEGELIDERIAQPLVPGTPVSVGVLCDSDGGVVEVLPVAMQVLSDDGRFRYLGGQVPWQGTGANESRTLVSRTCQTLSKLAGYVGVDLAVPLASPESPLVVEINPRLTTSYLGYRQMTNENLASRLLHSSPQDGSLDWDSGSVEFLPDGRVQHFSGTTIMPIRKSFTDCDSDQR